MSMSNPESTGDVNAEVSTASRCYAVALGSDVSATLVTYGITFDLYTRGMFYGLPVGKQSSIQIRTADQASSHDLKLHVAQIEQGEGHVSVCAPLTPTPPNYRSPEGRALLGPPQVLACRIVVVPPANKKIRWSDAEIQALKRAATAKCALCIIVFQGLSKDEKSLLNACFNSVFTVEPCEPDEPFASACMAAPMTGSLLAATGHKSVLENICMNSEGVIKRQCQSCVSPEKLTREIYRLRESGRSLQEIGEELGFDKSTISRRLSALPYHLRRHCM